MNVCTHRSLIGIHHMTISLACILTCFDVRDTPLLNKWATRSQISCTHAVPSRIPDLYIRRTAVIIEQTAIICGEHWTMQVKQSSGFRNEFTTTGYDAVTWSKGNGRIYCAMREGGGGTAPCTVQRLHCRTGIRKAAQMFTFWLHPFITMPAANGCINYWIAFSLPNPTRLVFVSNSFSYSALFYTWPLYDLKTNNIFFHLNSLFVTICPETFSNRCVDSANGM